MKQFGIAASLLVALGGIHHSTSAQMTAQQAEALPDVVAGVSLARYIGGGGGPYWGFELTNGGAGFRMQHPGPGIPPAIHLGVITSQTNLLGGNWLIEGTVGVQPITVLIERMGPSGCSDGHVDGQDRVLVAWDGYLYRGCGNLM